MKKWFFRTGVVVSVSIIVLVLFAQHIQATRIYAMTAAAVTDSSDVWLVPQPYELQSSSSAEAQSNVVVDSLTAPLIFTEESFDEGDHGYIARGAAQSLWILRNPVNIRESVLGDLAVDDRQVLCRGFDLASGVEACSSEYDFMKAMFFTTPHATTWYSSKNQKVGFSVLITLKASYGAPEKEFSTPALRGFLLQSQSSTVAEIFTHFGEHYQVMFSGYSDAEIDYTLANIQIAE